jgi:hypothetical protein
MDPTTLPDPCDAGEFSKKFLPGGSFLLDTAALLAGGPGISHTGTPPEP